ncbi:DUF2892 domain-containing protein [Rubrivivax rivuli]|uniref:DUF2892 domain-containing protein n=1 Tax=Rubrivivax rivuli TaxID=1862385 RepID=A0A437RSZ9_9BURK|nr:DUF2892 domain-containing protein [Rubrivivax rivuli]
MAKNMSGYDRVFRILLGLFLIAFAISGKVGGWAWVVGLVMLLTASLARCPMYALLGFRVRKSG